MANGHQYLHCLTRLDLRGAIALGSRCQLSAALLQHIQDYKSYKHLRCEEITVFFVIFWSRVKSCCGFSMRFAVRFSMDDFRCEHAKVSWNDGQSHGCWRRSAVGPHVWTMATSTPRLRVASFQKFPTLNHSKSSKSTWFNMDLNGIKAWLIWSVGTCRSKGCRCFGFQDGCSDTQVLQSLMEARISMEESVSQVDDLQRKNCRTKSCLKMTL